MSRTQKTYKHFTFRFKKTWQQTTLKLCTMCGTRCCGDPITIDGTKSKNKSKGTHKEKRYFVQDFVEDFDDDFDEHIVENLLEEILEKILQDLEDD